MVERNQTKKLGTVQRRSSAARGTNSDSPAQPSTPMTRAEAKKATTEIREGATEVFRKVKEVHDRQGWVALGYETWEGYLKTELDLSRREGFRLLTQGRIVQELESATGTTLSAGTVTGRGAEVLAQEPEKRKRIIRRAQEAPEEERPEIIRTEVKAVQEEKTDGNGSAARGTNSHSDAQSTRKRAPGGPLPADITEQMTTVCKRLHSFIDQELPMKMGLKKAKSFYDKVLDPLLADIDRWRELVDVLESREVNAQR